MTYGPSAAKAERDKEAHFGMTEQLAEKVQFSTQNPRNVPQGLKPRIDSMNIVPRIKSPAYPPNEFFRSL